MNRRARSFEPLARMTASEARHAASAYVALARRAHRQAVAQADANERDAWERERDACMATARMLRAFAYARDARAWPRVLNVLAREIEAL